MEIILQAKQIERNYEVGRNRLQVLKGVSMEVRRGETLSVMGASGSGKSTLLHVLGGLDRPHAGSVRFAGQEVYAMSPRRRARFRAENVGFVFQSFHLLPELDVLENVALPALALRTPRCARNRAAELLDEVGLGERMLHRPQELSGGERQRVALARALMNDPDLILADEPTGNLDSTTGDKVLHYLFQLVASKGHSLVLVTHSDEVAARCSRQLVLRDGFMV